MLPLSKDFTSFKKKAYAAKKAFIRKAKDKPCVDCGVRYPYYVMQFDHVRGGKLFCVCEGHRESWDAIHAEIDKCVVVCANCHMERTHGS